MFLNRFVGIRIISAVTAIIFFWSQGGLAQNLSQPQLVHPQVKLDIVQDVHCNLQTQNTIFNYLTDLHAQNQLSGILQEGASGNIDRSIWTRLNSVKRTKIVQGLYRDGWMGGAEKFAIEHPGVSYAGIELKALYEVHRDVYRDVIRKREAARESLRTLNAVVSSLKLKYYSNELIRLDNEWRIACHDGSRLFLFLKNNMKNIPFGRLSEFGADFKNLVEAIKTEKAPKNLSVDHFGAELEIFYEILRSRLLSSDEARRLAIVSDYLNLLNDLWNLELTPESYERFLSCESNTKLKIEIAYLLALENQTTSVSFFAYENRDAAKAYYEMAKQRDEAMYRNVLLALKNKRGHFVLVAGGFHGPDLARRFKKDPISVSLVQPRFTEIDPNLQEKYARAMGGFAAHKNLRMFLHNLMMLMPEPATVLPEVRELLEAASLGRDEAVPVPVVLSVDTPFQFTTKVTLRLKTDTDHEILMKNGEIVSGDFREALVEGANCFMKGPKPQVFQTRSGNFFSFKIDRNKEGALVLGTFLPSDPAREYSIRFQIEPEEADPELEIVGEPFINFPDQFSGEEYFTEWIRKRVSVAFVQLSDDLILIVKKTGDVSLAKIKEGKAFGSINSQADLEVIEKISVNASAGPVIIIPKSQSLKIHSLSDEQTSYQKPFFVNRNGDTLSLQLTEGGASWSAQRIEDIPIEPRPLARKFSWVKALSFLLLMPIVGYLLSTSKVKETPKFLLTPTPDVANPIIPAPVVSTTPAPIASPSVASVSSVQLQETVASDTTTAVSISPPAEMPSSAVVSKGGPDLPEAINNKISPATRAVFSAADGIVSISSDNKFLFVVQEDLLKKREVIQDRFNELVRSIPENEEQYKIDFHFNDAYRGNLNPVDPKAEQLMQELIQVSNELNRIDQDLLSGQVLIQDGRLLVKSGDHVVKGDGLIEYDIANRSKVEMRLPRKLAVALMLKQATLKSLNNVTAQADVSIPEGDISSPEIEKTVTIEFDTPTENIPIEIVKTEKGIRSEDSPSGPEIINVVAPRAGWVEINKNLLRLGKIRKGDVIATYSKPNIDAGIRRIEQKIIAAEAFADCLSVAFDKLTPLVAQAKADIVSFDNQLEGAFYNKPKVVQLIAEKQLRKDFLSDVEKIKLKRDTARSVVQQYETDKAKLESRSLPKTYVVKAPCDGDLIFSHPDQSYFWTNSGIVVKIIRTDAKSLGVEHVTPLTVDEPFRFSAKDKLKLKTETGREILFEEGEVVLGGAREPVVDGANCFMKGPKPQVFQTRSGNFFSFKIDRNKEGALVLGTFLPSDPAREYSIRFQIEPEEADPELEIVGEPFINFPDQFSGEEYFTEWIRKRVSVAFVQLSDDLILIVKKTGDVSLAKIKEGKAFGSINSQADLEVIEKISVNASAGPVIIIPKSQSLKIHSLSDEQTSYQKPFFVNRNGDTLSLQLTEGGASWSVEQFEDVPIEAEPSPKARKSPWIIIALGFTLPLIF